MTRWPKPIILASSSPRRRSLLEDAGIQVQLHPPSIDDGVYQVGDMHPSRWVKSLAHLKANVVFQEIQGVVGTVLAADTVCVVDNEMYGQPEDKQDAAAMLQRMNNRTHEVYTGWCLMSQEPSHCLLACEIVEVSISQLSDEEIETYLESGTWNGKAGAYNVAERIQAGWHIECAGDITSVMGLPMKRLLAEIVKE